MIESAAAHPLLLLDGATGSELERCGCDTSLPLWSARALIEAPEVVERVHRAYVEAGADFITANTFRTHRRTLARADMGDRAGQLTTRAVSLARRAIASTVRAARVLGSVAPLEDCYRPDLAPPAREAEREHDEMIAHLVDSGVDLILIETMNSVGEARAAIEAARRRAPGRWMVSFCCRGGETPGLLLSGESLATLAGECSDARAIGVNCVSAARIEPEVRFLRQWTAPEIPVAAYGNVGRPDGLQGWVNTDAIDPLRYADLAARWRRAGASIIGGCCGTTPATIRALAVRLRPTADSNPN